jgi:hypothetical protein
MDLPGDFAWKQMSRWWHCVVRAAHGVGTSLSSKERIAMRTNFGWRLAGPLVAVLCACQPGTIDSIGGITLEVTSALRTCSVVGRGSCINSLRVSSRNRDFDEQVYLRPLEHRDVISTPYVIPLPANEIRSDDEDGFLVVVSGLYEGIRLVGGSVHLTLGSKIPETVGINMTEQFAGCDIDGDGYEACGCVGWDPCDCNDQNPGVNPFTRETCGDGIDSDCDGSFDHVDCSACAELEGQPCGIGVGVCAHGVVACDEGSGASTCLSAGQPTVEVEDGIDNDCDGAVDEGSECTDGVTRDCFMGWVDAEARARARGICRVGVQSCVAGVWGAECVGEARAESVLESVCDGRDENCDGRVDDLRAFDTDGDGFTICGTCATAAQRAVVDVTSLPELDGDEPLLCSEAIDCDDDPAGHGAIVFPGNTELCTTPFDDDCRCDHDDPRFGGSTIGLPVIRKDGGSNCSAHSAGLRCDLLPRSDGGASGSCADDYFDDVYDMDGSLGCYRCGATYGLSCDGLTGACETDPEVSCTACDAPLPPDESLLHSTRPSCQVLVSGCSARSEPRWQPVVAGSDPHGDCTGGETCDGNGGCGVQVKP